MSVEALPERPGSLSAADLAQAFALFNRASEELSCAYNALQGQVAQLTERLSVLMTALPAGVVVTDKSGRIVQSNRAAHMLLGQGLEGHLWVDVSERLLQTGTPGEVSVRAGDQERRVSVSQTALDSGEGHIVLLHDVTEAHRMRLNAERNERLAAMGEMVAGLAHQLRTPLSAALLYAGHFCQPDLAAGQRAMVAERTIERLRHLERLIRDMLTFARGDSLERQRFGVCDLLSELTHTLEPVARARQLLFHSECLCGDLEVVGDRKSLAGALTNLLENAVQASYPGGVVRLEAYKEKDMVVCSVSDTGCGVPPNIETRLFDPFFTTRTDGTGLGLAIARGVARAHGGDITLQSFPGQGTRFLLTVSLPETPTETSP
jgi:two-component system, sensor histidine kinase FlrB